MMEALGGSLNEGTTLGTLVQFSYQKAKTCYLFAKLKNKTKLTLPRFGWGGRFKFGE